MDNSNIIISIIIVLCIAAGVTAYGISEGDNAVFSDLTGFSPDSSTSGDNGIGNTSVDNTNGTSNGLSDIINNNPITGGGSSASSSGSSGSGSSGSGSGSSGSGSSGNGGSSSQGQTNPQPQQNQTQTTKISQSEASSIASGFIEEEGAYVSSVVDDGSEYICYISDADGNNVDAIAISYSGANLGRA